ncbi:MAG: hypothetical protein K9K67_03785 [Bacteriovoracaceae bacterium]|nr:hypothetical protein [Bacteriovoracaceae bacterium]
MTFFLQAQVFGQSCNPENDRDHRRPTFYNEETQTHIMRDQGDSGWCYAFSTADLVTDYLYKNNPEILTQTPEREDQLISPVSLLPAIASFSEGQSDGRFTQMTEGGQVTQMMIDIVASVDPRNRICLESEVRSSNFTINGEEIDVLALLDNLELQYNPQTNDQILCQQVGLLNRTILPNLEVSDVVNILNQIQSTNKPITSINYISQVISESCKNPLPTLKLPEVKRVRRTNTDGSDNQEDFLAAIDQQLLSGSILALEYNGYLLESSEGLDAKGFPIEAPHVSTIVGRRCIDGESQYLIRNSYGPTCDFYLEELDCDEGNIWVPKELLLRMSRRVNYL